MLHNGQTGTCTSYKKSHIVNKKCDCVTSNQSTIKQMFWASPVTTCLFVSRCTFVVCIGYVIFAKNVLTGITSHGKEVYIIKDYFNKCKFYSDKFNKKKKKEKVLEMGLTQAFAGFLRAVLSQIRKLHVRLLGCTAGDPKRLFKP